MDLFYLNREIEKEKNIKLVLASASPRRRELFKLVAEDFQCLSPDIEESFPPDMDVYGVPQYLAQRKAEFISRGLDSDHVVIGCDTGVFIGGKMLGKPRDRKEAFSMLALLSGREHKVITGCCITDGVSTKAFSVCSSVWFYPLSDEDIRSYVDTGEPSDKAGAYGIQGKGSLLVEKICGDYFNIVGLPVSRLARELTAFLNIKEKSIE